MLFCGILGLAWIMIGSRKSPKPEKGDEAHTSTSRFVARTIVSQ
jgi:hypothetical protein